MVHRRDAATPPTLLSRLRDLGDAQAWFEFEARYRGLVLVHCLRHGLQRADAEDVLQAVMLGLSRSMPKFQYRPQRGRFRSYLGKIVNRAIHAQRTRPIGALNALCMEEPPTAVDDQFLDEKWERRMGGSSLSARLAGVAEETRRPLAGRVPRT